MTQTRAQRRRLERELIGLPERVIGLRKAAFTRPWDGRSRPGPRHRMIWSALTEPGRRTSILCTFETMYHGSGWWKNADYEQCLHLSISHPTGREIVRMMPESMGGGMQRLQDCEAPSLAECQAWARVFYGPDASKAWYEPPASTLDAYRLPGVGHLRVFYDPETNEPFIPDGEVYTLKRLEGLTPEKLR
jgi:hypothetical protein